MRCTSGADVVKPEDRRILLDVAECKRLAELALDRGDVDAFVDFYTKAEAELFCLVWRQELAGPLSPAEELTPLQALQADARALVSRARGARATYACRLPQLPWSAGRGRGSARLMLSVDDVREGLERRGLIVRKVGRGYLGQCPAHHDRESVARLRRRRRRRRLHPLSRRLPGPRRRHGARRRRHRGPALGRGARAPARRRRSGQERADRTRPSPVRARARPP